jgi:protein arginine kinase activator
MKCDHCQNPAVVHEVVIKQGVTHEVHLCAEHAAAQGHQVPTGPDQAPDVQIQFAVVGPMGMPPGGMGGPASGVGSGQGGKPRTPKQVKSCPNCGLVFASIRQHGLLGCAECYRAFETELTGLIEQAQAGGNFHCGRSPRDCRDAAARLELRSRLAKELDEAVAAEQYERAAKLRDRLLHLASEPLTDNASDAGD